MYKYKLMFIFLGTFILHALCVVSIAQVELTVESGGEQTSVVEIPETWSQESRQTLENIAQINGAWRGVAGLLVVGFHIQTRSDNPDTVARAISNSNQLVDALDATETIERRKVLDQITLIRMSGDLSNEEKEFWENFEQRVRGGDIASSSGDPHLVTLDGRHYSFQGAGEFVAAQSNNRDLEVQLRFEPWLDSSKFTVSTAAAFKVGTDRICVLKGDSNIYINQSPIPLHEEITVLDSGGFVVINEGAINVIWPDGSVATVVNAFDLVVTLKVVRNREGQIAGLFGNYDGDPSNDIRKKNGEIINLNNLEGREYGELLYNVFGNEWRVSAQDSLFVYKSGETTDSFQKADYPSDIFNIKSIDTKNLQMAINVCEQSGLSEGDYAEQCIYDVAATGEVGFIDSALTVSRLRYTQPLEMSDFTTSDLDKCLTLTCPQLHKHESIPKNLIHLQCDDNYYLNCGYRGLDIENGDQKVCVGIESYCERDDQCCGGMPCNSNGLCKQLKEGDACSGAGACEGALICNKKSGELVGVCGW